jgi:hypothetical protein
MKWSQMLSGGSWNYAGASCYRPSMKAAKQRFIYRFLLNSHTHSPLARSMHTAIKQARVNDKFQDPLYLFLELVRAGVMHGHLWSGRAFSGGPSFGTGETPPFPRLI